MDHRIYQMLLSQLKLLLELLVAAVRQHLLLIVLNLVLVVVVRDLVVVFDDVFLLIQLEKCCLLCFLVVRGMLKIVKESLWLENV